MNTTPYRLPPALYLVRLLAGYFQWSEALSADNPDCQADDLTVESFLQASPNFGGVKPDVLLVYQTYLSGQDWNGEFDRPIFACLKPKSGWCPTKYNTPGARSENSAIRTKAAKSVHRRIRSNHGWDTPKGATR